MDISPLAHSGLFLQKTLISIANIFSDNSNPFICGMLMSTAKIQVTGPFGHQEESDFTNANRTAGTGFVIEYVVRLDLAKNDFPSGYQYQIGIGAPDLCSPTQTPFDILNATSTGGNQYYSYSYNDGIPTLVPMSPQNGTGH